MSKIAYVLGLVVGPWGLGQLGVIWETSVLGWGEEARGGQDAGVEALKWLKQALGGLVEGGEGYLVLARAPDGQ